MNMLFDLLKSIRISHCFLVVLLGFIGYKYSGIDPNSLILLTLFSIIAVTMVQNDWEDRVHDLKKGKRFAYENSQVYFMWLILAWIFCMLMMIIVFRINFITFLFFTIFVVLAFFYSRARKVPFLSLILVTISVPSSLLIPLTFGSSFSSISLVFAATFFIMFGRETLHDVADTNADIGYKKTLSVLKGETLPRILSTITLFIGCLFSIIFLPSSLFGASFILWGITRIEEDKDLIWVRRRVDIGILLTVLILALV